MRFAMAGRKGIKKETLIVCDTPKRFQKAKEIFKKIRDDYEKNFHTVAGGISGIFDKDHSKLLNSPNLEDWKNKPLKKAIGEIFNANKVLLTNDADMEGLGEAVYGAGKGREIVAYITLGTGIGGTRIVNGRLDKNAFGFEPGHQIIFLKGRKCSCGGRGHLESYASGTAIKKIYGKTGSELNKKELKEVIEVLAAGLNNVVVFWSPDIIVLNGGLMEDNVFHLPMLRERVKKKIKVFNKVPAIKKYSLGSFSGLYGALEILKRSS